MKSVKKFVNVLSVVGLLSVAAGVTASAANTDEVKLNRKLVKENTLQLYLEDVNALAKAYQISLKINGNVKLDTIKMANSANSDIQTNYVYHEDSNEIDVYVTSTASLLDENDDIDIGTLSVKGTAGESFNVVPVENSLKIVTEANKEHVLNGVEATGSSDFIVSDANNDHLEQVPAEKPNKLEGALTFKDLTSSYRAYEEISYLSVGKIVVGDQSNHFIPNRQVTRAEAAAMIGRALQLDGEKRSTVFKDVGVNNFASGFIQSAVDSGIISGYGDGTFRPDEIVTRGEMAIMISRAFGYDFEGTTGAGEALMKRGISQGISDGTFGADQKLIRADFAVFLARAIDSELRIGKPTITFEGEKTVAVDELIVRTGPSNDYSKASELRKNAKVSTGYEVGKWTVVKTEKGVIGFVPNEALK